MVICSPPLMLSPACFEKPVITVLPSVRGVPYSASSSSVRTISLPPSAEKPSGTLTLIMSRPTRLKLVTTMLSGNTISLTPARPEPLMVIWAPGTTFVGKTVLIFSPRSVISSGSSKVHAVKNPIRATVSNTPKYLNIFFIIEILLNRLEYYHPGFWGSRLGFFFNSL